jgi:hypothetical protein
LRPSSSASFWTSAEIVFKLGVWRARELNAAGSASIASNEIEAIETSRTMNASRFVTKSA